MSNAKALQKNEALTRSFDHLADLAQGRRQTLIATDEKTYISFYTDTLLSSFGYNNPEINRDINAFIKDHQRTPVNPAILTTELQEQLTKLLPKRLHHIRIDGADVLSPILKALTVNGHFRFLCLEKPPAFMGSPYADALVTLEELSEGASPAAPDTLLPEASALRQILKKHRGILAGCIVNPVLLGRGMVAREKNLDLLLSQLKKAKIPLIWDDSQAAFFRLGPAFTSELYGAEPDALIYSHRITEGRSVHFAALSKKLSKRLEEAPAAVGASDIPGLIILRSLLKHIGQNHYDRSTRDLGTRIQGKLRALEANCGQKFSMAGRGLTWFIDLPSTEDRRAFIAAMAEAGYLLKALPTKADAVFIYPPLCLSEANADMLIEAMKRFFEDQ
ncbi:MAG: aminotransferase class III-fold pyridoxal phosphate-dependent enzyme [Eubacterium sp.]|nr:aminotransferase class III-fold pyridoxal phosphate-dependent enzyme [Eubacterium sp.]